MENQVNCGVYSILHIESGKRYIGSSINVPKRFTGHCSALNLNKHTNRHLQSAWNKYGARAFSFQKVLICSPENRVFYEQLLIDGYKVANRNFGFNKLPIAESRLGLKHSQETREKLRKIKIGGKSNKGSHWSEEAREKISILRKGRPLSKGMDRTGKTPWNKGVPRTEEEKGKMSKSLMGRLVWNKGKNAKPETIEKMRQERTGRKIGKYKSGNAIKTHCPKGHPYSGENLYNHPDANRRGCKTCIKAAAKRGGNL